MRGTNFSPTLICFFFKLAEVVHKKSHFTQFGIEADFANVFSSLHLQVVICDSEEGLGWPTLGFWCLGAKLNLGCYPHGDIGWGLRDGSCWGLRCQGAGPSEPEKILL